MLDVDALYRQYGDAVRRYLSRRISDSETANELAQEVWARVLLHRDRYRETGAPIESWLFCIARNLLTDHWRRRATVAIVRLGEIQPTYTMIGRDEHVAHLDTRASLAGAWQHLTGAQRDVIRARFFEDCSTREASDRTGHTENGVKKLQQRALVNLRRALEGAA